MFTIQLRYTDPDGYEYKETREMTTSRADWYEDALDHLKSEIYSGGLAEMFAQLSSAVEAGPPAAANHCTCSEYRGVHAPNCALRIVGN